MVSLGSKRGLSEPYLRNMRKGHVRQCPCDLDLPSSLAVYSFSSPNEVTSESVQSDKQ